MSTSKSDVPVHSENGASKKIQPETSASKKVQAETGAPKKIQPETDASKKIQPETGETPKNRECSEELITLTNGHETPGQDVVRPAREEVQIHSLPVSFGEENVNQPVTADQTDKPTSQAVTSPKIEPVINGFAAGIDFSEPATLSENLPSAELVKTVPVTTDKLPNGDVNDIDMGAKPLPDTEDNLENGEGYCNVEVTDVIVKQELIDAYNEAAFGNDIVNMVVDEEVEDEEMEDNVSDTEMDISDEDEPEKEGYMRYFYCYFCLDDVLDGKVNKCKYCKPMWSTDKMANYNKEAVKTEKHNFRQSYKQGSCVICFGEAPDANQNSLFTLCKMCETSIDRALA